MLLGDKQKEDSGKGLKGRQPHGIVKGVEGLGSISELERGSK